MKQFLTILAFFVYIFSINAQYPNGIHPEHKRANIWYFGLDSIWGVVELDFNSGQLEHSMTTFGNSMGYSQTSISDTAGNFMFHANGDNVFNSNYQYIASTWGHNWAPYGALFIPVPGSDSLLILFHSSCWDDNFSGGLRYTIINALANSGQGEVVEQDIPLLTGAAGSVIAAYHDNGTDFWAVSADTAGYIYSWLIDSSLIPQPTDTMHITTVLSEFGTPICRIMPDFTTRPEADLIAVTSVDFENGECTDYTVSLVHFDNVTGEFKNELLIESHEGEVVSGDYFSMMPSFSPQGDWVYIPFAENTVPRNGYIKRYSNLYNAGVPGEISSEIVYNTTTYAAPATNFHTPVGTMIFYAISEIDPNSASTPYISTILYPDSSSPVVLHDNINTGALTTWSPINNIPAQWYYRPYGYYTGREKIKNENLLIGPNPADDVIYILNGFINIMDVCLYDVTGKKYYAEIKDNYEINMHHLKNGIYLLKITFTNGMWKTCKVIVQH